MKLSMVLHVKRDSSSPQTSAINNLILIEQALNAANLPVICVFLARVAMPEWSGIILGHYPICVVVQV